MRGHDEVAGPLPASLHHVDLRRPAAVIGEHPERRPHPGANRYLGADFEIAVLLRKFALRRQDARDVFIVEQHGFQRGRGAAGDDRENAVADPERVEPERYGGAPAIARIDIDLLFAVPACLALEVGAVAAPVARFRPGGAAGVMRHPSVAGKRMSVEIIVEGPMQRHRHARLLRLDLAARVAEQAGRRLQGELRRRVGGIALAPEPARPRKGRRSMRAHAASICRSLVHALRGVVVEGQDTKDTTAFGRLVTRQHHTIPASI